MERLSSFPGTRHFLTYKQICSKWKTESLYEVKGIYS